MDTRDSGVIDLFAIHKEEEQRAIAPAAPSAPPPAVSFDTNLGGADADVDALAASQQASRMKAKIVGGVVGAMAVIGILIAAISSGEKAAPPKDASVASQPPPAAEVVPAPAPSPSPVAAATPAPTTDDNAYTRADAIAANNKAQGKATGKKRALAAKASGPKLTKIVSGGTN